MHCSTQLHATSPHSPSLCGLTACLDFEPKPPHMARARRKLSGWCGGHETPPSSCCGRRVPVPAAVPQEAVRPAQHHSSPASSFSPCPSPSFQRPSCGPRRQKSSARPAASDQRCVALREAVAHHQRATTQEPPRLVCLVPHSCHTSTLESLPNQAEWEITVRAGNQPLFLQASAADALGTPRDVGGSNSSPFPAGSCINSLALLTSPRAADVGIINLSLFPTAR